MAPPSYSIEQTVGEAVVPQGGQPPDLAGSVASLCAVAVERLEPSPRSQRVITQLNPPKPMETSKGVDWAHFVIDPRAAERSASTRGCLELPWLLSSWPLSSSA
jgi:hypothetical protein